MESFVHLRKGTHPAAAARRPGRPEGRRTRPRRVHRPHRQHLPPKRPHRLPQRRARCGPSTCCPSELKPSDATDAAGGPLLLFSNADCQVLLSRRSEPMPFFVRYVDGDLLSLRAQGLRPAGDRVRPAALPRGRLGVHPEGLHVPPGARRRSRTLLMIQATDEFRVPPPGHAGQALPVRPVAGRRSPSPRRSTTLRPPAATSTRCG